MSDQHNRFLSRLRDSSRAVFTVAFVQHGRGRKVEIPAIKFAPDASQHEQFVDEGDLYVWVGDKRLRFEIKHLGVNFTGPSDWPFKEAFVSNVAAVDRAKDVHFYVSVSNDCRFAAVISGRTKDHWYKTTTHAQNTGNAENYYACPIELVTFENLKYAGHQNGFVGYDKDDNFIHYCRCGRDAGHGFGVRLRDGILGRWYCDEHKHEHKGEAHGKESRTA